MKPVSVKDIMSDPVSIGPNQSLGKEFSKSGLFFFFSP